MNDNNSFSSIDRLIEFGMGMSVAQQMIKTMNGSMAQMNVPGAGTPLRQEQLKYYVAVNNGVAGPFTEEELETLVKACTITPDTLVCKQGMTGWAKAKDVPEVNKIILLNTNIPVKQ